MFTIFTDTDTDLTPKEAKYYGYKMISMPYIIDDIYTLVQKDEMHFNSLNEGIQKRWYRLLEF